ncbi:hypothetical protein C0993_011459 [Termitomyces sp. T159_Od127]|nr:hypothetical protein C0993_011459 [Termitomyces sp. T159_Od127]
MTQPPEAKTMMLRHTARVFRPSFFTSRNILTVSRLIRVSLPESRVSRARTKRLFTTDFNTVPLKFDWGINSDQYNKLLAHAHKFWPPPPFVPPNWSSTWSDWEALPSYYSFSPYYLMLPQIQMHINIQYGIRGETRPLLFSNKRDAFIFTIVHSDHYFLFDGCYSALYYIQDVCNDHQLVELVAQGDDAIVAKLQAVEESEEGLSALERIMARDETVIPLLAEKFLNYTPAPTTPKMERNAKDSSPEKDAQFADFMSRWQREAAEEQNDDADDSDDKDLQRSDEIRKLDDEIGHLKSTLSTLLDANQPKEKEANMMTEEKKEGAGKVAEGKADEAAEEGTDEVDVEGVMMLREKVAKFAQVVEVSDPKDIPPEQLERVKEETKALKARTDELISEMENLSVESHQVEVFQQMKTTAKSLRERVDELSLTDGHMMALYLVRSLEQNLGVIKNNSKAVDGDNDW